MIRPILARPNKEKTGFHFDSEYNRKMLLSWLKKYDLFEIKPRAKNTRKRRAFLEAAVIPCWGKFNYNLDPRNPDDVAKARLLFKHDFHYEIVKDRQGNPKRIEKSLEGEHAEVLEIYTRYAEENGAPIPNPALYKLYKDKYSMEFRWSNYYDWLEYVGLEVDSMPSREALERLDRDVDKRA